MRGLAWRGLDKPAHAALFGAHIFLIGAWRGATDEPRIIITFRHALMGIAHLAWAGNRAAVLDEKWRRSISIAEAAQCRRC